MVKDNKELKTTSPGKSITFNMSYSALNTYLESERTFYYSKIAKVKPTDKVIECYGNAGNFVHNAIENHINGIKNDYQLQWEEMGLESQYDFRGQTLPYENYLSYIDNGINFIKRFNSDVVLTSEMAFTFPYEYDSNVTIKGFIDLVAINKRGEVMLFDWKTDSKANHEKHYKQRLFYAWAYWKTTGIVPTNCNWQYLRLGNKREDTFKEIDLKDFEVELYGVIDAIIKNGDNVYNYEVGDIGSPFNGYKSLIKKSIEEEKMVDLLDKGNIKVKSEEQKILESIRNDKYSKGAMVGAYMNHWVNEQIKSKGQLPTFEEFVNHNVKCKMELEKIEY